LFALLSRSPQRMRALSCPATRAPRLLRGAAVRLLVSSLLLLLADGGLAYAQERAVAEAAALRDQRDFAGAAAVLRAHLARYPDDGGATRMLAETLYWLGDTAGAQREYEQALPRFPDDVRLHLDYARLLADTRQLGRTREVLLTVRGRGGPGEAEIEARLGTLAYWRGERSAAAEHFRTALVYQPDHADARRQLDEIRQLTAPWIATGASLRSDDQPLRRAGVVAEAGWFLSPQHGIVLQTAPTRYGAERGWLSLHGSVLLHSDWSGTRLQSRAGVGLLRRGDDVGEAVTGRLGVSLRLAAGVGMHFDVEREPYDWTLASIETLIVTDAGSGRLTWETEKGWMTEAAATVRRFPDDNQVSNAYGWALIPIVRTGSARLSAGYGFSYADATESRWRPRAVEETQGGRYTPYYTPDTQRIHSAIGTLSLPLGEGMTFSANGGYGIHATERAPDGVYPILWTYERRYTPWNARAALSLAPAPGVSLELVGEHGRTAYYRMNSASVRLTYRPVIR
jgi:tetratricopeptide (TPR) repeat protein